MVGHLLAQESAVPSEKILRTGRREGWKQLLKSKVPWPRGGQGIRFQFVVGILFCCAQRDGPERRALFRRSRRDNDPSSVRAQPDVRLPIECDGNEIVL